MNGKSQFGCQQPKPDEPARVDRALQTHQQQQLTSLKRQRELQMEICKIQTTPLIAAEVDRRVFEHAQALLDQRMNLVLVSMGQTPVTRSSDFGVPFSEWSPEAQALHTSREQLSTIEKQIQRLVNSINADHLMSLN
jgi:hypothetical protein